MLIREVKIGNRTRRYGLANKQGTIPARITASDMAAVTRDAKRTNLALTKIELPGGKNFSSQQLWILKRKKGK